MDVDSGLEQGYSRESSGNDHTGPTSNRRLPPPSLPSSEQPDVVLQTSVAVATVTVAIDSEGDNNKSADNSDSKRETRSGGDEKNDFVEYPR